MEESLVGNNKPKLMHHSILCTIEQILQAKADIEAAKARVEEARRDVCILSTIERHYGY